MRCLFPDLQYNSCVADFLTKPTIQLMNDVGGNTGNMLFRHAIVSQVADELVPCSFGEAVKLSSEQSFDAVVVAAANWLHSSSHNHNRHRARALRAMNLPTICIGLGCQHHEPAQEKFKFHEDTIDLLNILNDLNAHVLVRDVTTYDQCRHYGLQNVFIVGCPSNFINHSPDFNKKLFERSSKCKWDSVTLDAGWFDVQTLPLDTKLLPLVIGTGGKYVLQSNHRNIVAMALGRKEEYTRDDIAFFKKSFRFKMFPWKSDWKFERFQQVLSVYFDVNEWLCAADEWDIVLGCRIHGAMAAIQAGVPAILTTIDSRTIGLAETMAIPHIALADTCSWTSETKIEQIYNEVSPDFSAYIKRRTELADYYSSILKNFGLSFTESFQNMLLRAQNHV